MHLFILIQRMQYMRYSNSALFVIDPFRTAFCFLKSLRLTVLMDMLARLDSEMGIICHTILYGHLILLRKKECVRNFMAVCSLIIKTAGLKQRGSCKKSTSPNKGFFAMLAGEPACRQAGISIDISPINCSPGSTSTEYRRIAKPLPLITYFTFSALNKKLKQPPINRGSLP